MMRLKRSFFGLMVVCLIAGGFCPSASAWEKWTKNDPVSDGWNALDLLVARPLGVVAGIAGSAIFVVSLPFTIPAGAVDDAAKMFIVSPFKFSFKREFPDEDM